MHNWAGVGWGRRSTDHSLLILARASRFKHVYSSTIFENILKPSDIIHFYICLNEIYWQLNWGLQPEVDLLMHQIGGQGLVSLKWPDLYFVIHRNNTTEKVFVCTIFIFPVHDTILCPSRAKDTRFRPIPQIFLPSKNPGIENFKPHKILRSPPSPEISSSWKRPWIRSNKVFPFHEYSTFYYCTEPQSIYRTKTPEVRSRNSPRMK